MPGKYKASVVICTYNRLSLLKLCIESISTLKTFASEFETVVIDNNSSDGTEEFCNGLNKLYPNNNWRYFKETNQGISFARTRGASSWVARPW